MFERENTAALVGVFDTVRKNADTEFARRPTAASATRVHIHTELPPLTVQRLESTSLSGSEILPRWLHEARTIYGANYNAWHTKIRARAASPVLDPTAPRPFAAPSHLSGIPAEPLELDLIVVLDLVRRSGELRDFAPITQRLRALAGAGMSIGIVHAWSVGLFQEAQAQYPAQLQQLELDGLARILISGEPAHARFGLVPDPSALQFPGAKSTLVPFDRLIAASTLGDSPHHPGGG